MPDRYASLSGPLCPENLEEVIRNTAFGDPDGLAAGVQNATPS